MNSEEGRNEDDVQEPNGKKRKSNHYGDGSNDVEDRNETAIVVDNGSSLLNDKYVFNAVMAWLNTADVSRCCQVCKGWNNQITQQTWKEAAKSKSKVGYKALFDALQKRKDSGGLDAKAMAIGLSRLPTRREPTINIQKPTLKPSDVFLHLELSIDVSQHPRNQSQSSQRKCEYSWCQSLQGCCGGFGNDGFASVVFLDARNGLSFRSSSSDNKVDEPIKIDSFELRPVFSSLQIERDLFFGDLEFLLKNMQITKRLFRADTGKSVLLTHETKFNEFSRGQLDGCYFESEDLKAMASTQEGTAAREMCAFQSYNYLQVETAVRLSPILPQEGSPDEPDWAPSMRCGGRYQFSSILDYSEFLNTNFEYQIDSIKSDFRFSVGEDECANDNVDSVDHFMLFIEGLVWE